MSDSPRHIAASNDLDALINQNSSCAGLHEHGTRVNVCKTTPADSQAVTGGLDTIKNGEVIFTPPKWGHLGLQETRPPAAAAAVGETPRAVVPDSEKVVQQPPAVRANQGEPLRPGAETFVPQPPVDPRAAFARPAPRPTTRDVSGFDPAIALFKDNTATMYGRGVKLNLEAKAGIPNNEVPGPNPTAAVTGPGRDALAGRRAEPPPALVEEVGLRRPPEPKKQDEKPEPQRSSAPRQDQPQPSPTAPTKGLDQPIAPAPMQNPITAFFNLFTPSPYTDGQPTPYDPTGPVHAVNFGRPGETVPSKIVNPNQFTHDYLDATKAAAIRLYRETHGHTGDCATGPREGVDSLGQGWNILPDLKIGDLNLRWRSATQLGEYLFRTGLFDKYPLADMKHQLRDGFTIVRGWNDSVIKAHGEDKGDIAVVSHNGMQYNDHTDRFEFDNSRYNMKTSYVLVPKGYDFSKEPVMQIDDSGPSRVAQRGGRRHVSHEPAHHRRRR